jgi:dTDP-4-dehydrorhamnose reductase
MKATKHSPHVLITGASGFLGNYLLKLAPESLLVLGQYRNHRPIVCPANCSLVRQDFLDSMDEFLARYRPGVIIHTAAMAQLDECEEKPELADRLNVQVTEQLAKWAAQIGARFIFISTDIVFDGTRGNYTESDQPRSINHYGKTKTEAEQRVLRLHPDAVVVRTSIIYGKALGGRPSFTEVLLRRLRHGENVPVFTDQYRSPVFVEDLGRAIWELAENDFRGILHVAGPERLSRERIGEIVCEVFRLNPELLVPIQTEDIQLRAPRPLDTSLNIDLATRVLNTPLQPFRDGIRQAFPEWEA